MLYALGGALKASRQRASESVLRAFSTKVGGYTVVDHKYDAVVVGAGAYRNIQFDD
jgi:hypothetical protein